MTSGFTGSGRKPRPWRLAIARAFGSVVVTVHGALDSRTSELVRHALADLIEGQGNLFLVMDLRDMVVTDSGELSVFAEARRSLEERNGRFVLGAPSKEAGEALQEAGLGEVIEVHFERRYHPSLGHDSVSRDGDHLGGTRRAL
ncbi:MAG: STAS domain-containing protein [Actinobacteria bacterium]|nr:STAS domain-containing protein [Actinomycetota bacterium]